MAHLFVAQDFFGGYFLTEEPYRVDRLASRNCFSSMKDWTIFRFPSDAFLFRFRKIGKLKGIPEEDVRKALYRKKACMASTWCLVMKTYQTVLVVLSRLHVSSPFWTWGLPSARALSKARHLGFLSWKFLGQQHAIWSLWFGPDGSSHSGQQFRAVESFPGEVRRWFSNSKRIPC